MKRMLMLGAAMLMIAAATVAGLRAGDTEAATAQVTEVTLVAEPVFWEIQPGLTVEGWGYNGNVPGPTIRVREGDRLRVRLENKLPVPTTIHWHGVDVPLDQDGVPGVSQEPVEPGASFTYDFVATNPGTRWYHSHVDSNTQIQMGLYGALIVDPKVPEPVTYDREYTYILSEKALDFTPQVAMGQTTLRNTEGGNGRGGALLYDLFLMNGRAGSAIDTLGIAQGEKIRVRLINAGNLVHTIHSHGHTFTLIATDGNPIPPAAQLKKDTVTIGPAERYDIVIEGTNPGIWMFHCHINNHSANGMVTELRYDGATPVAGGDHSAAHAPATPSSSTGAPATNSPAQPAAGHDHHHGPASATTSAVPTTPAAPPATVTPSMTAPADGDEVVMGMVDDRFTPSRLTLKAGGTLTWVNRGLNGHTVSSYAGLFDSGLLASGERFSFTFTEPGTYRFLCRQHLLQGMQGTITVEAP